MGRRWTATAKTIIRTTRSRFPRVLLRSGSLLSPVGAASTEANRRGHHHSQHRPAHLCLPSLLPRYRSVIPTIFPHPRPLPPLAPLVVRCFQPSCPKVFVGTFSGSQVSKNVMVGQRRQSATVLGGNGLRPMTTLAPGESSRNGHGNNTALSEATERAETKRRAMARNRSWADDYDYHTSGW